MPFVWPFAVFGSTAISGLTELRCGLGEVVVVLVGYIEQRMIILIQGGLAGTAPARSIAGIVIGRILRGSMSSLPNLNHEGRSQCCEGYIPARTQ